MENLETKQVETTTTDTEVATEEQKGKFYSEEEIELIKQQAGDKRISQYQKTLEKKQREAAKLSQMTDAEKEDYRLSERERLLDERENALILAENKATVSQILAEKGLSLNLVEFCVDADADEMKRRISVIERAFKASVKTEVEKRLGAKSPVKSESIGNNITKAEFAKMNYAQRTALKEQDKELYELLTN